jgi:hypothetical protein
MSNTRAEAAGLYGTISHVEENVQKLKMKVQKVRFSVPRRWQEARNRGAELSGS